MESNEDCQALMLSLVGKPNAGKSSLYNKLLGFDRTIVSDVEGTTRDAIDTEFTYNGKEFTLIDTAGFDDVSELGELRMQKTRLASEKVDIAIILKECRQKH